MDSGEGVILCAFGNQGRAKEKDPKDQKDQKDQKGKKYLEGQMAMGLVTMEAAGVEPASESVAGGTSTSVVRRFMRFALGHAGGQARLRLSR